MLVRRSTPALTKNRSELILARGLKVVALDLAARSSVHLPRLSVRYSHSSRVLSAMRMREEAAKPRVAVL